MDEQLIRLILKPLTVMLWRGTFPWQLASMIPRAGIMNRGDGGVGIPRPGQGGKRARARYLLRDVNMSARRVAWLTLLRQEVMLDQSVFPLVSPLATRASQPWAPVAAGKQR